MRLCHIGQREPVGDLQAFRGQNDVGDRKGERYGKRILPGGDGHGSGVVSGQAGAVRAQGNVDGLDGIAHRHAIAANRLQCVIDEKRRLTGGIPLCDVPVVCGEGVQSGVFRNVYRKLPVAFGKNRRAPIPCDGGTQGIGGNVAAEDLEPRGSAARRVHDDGIAYRPDGGIRIQPFVPVKNSGSHKDTSLYSEFTESIA